MDAQELQLPQNHQVVMNRFVAASQADERVVAASLSGSYLARLLYGRLEQLCNARLKD